MKACVTFTSVHMVGVSIFDRTRLGRRVVDTSSFSVRSSHSHSHRMQSCDLGGWLSNNTCSHIVAEVGLASLGDGMALLLSTPIYMFLIKRIRLPAVCAIGFLVSAITPIIPYVELEPLLVVRCAHSFQTALSSAVRYVMLSHEMPPAAQCICGIHLKKIL